MRKRVVAAISQAEAGFNRCWDTLCEVKKGRVLRTATLERLFEFQFDLATALHCLSDEYRGIAEAKRATIARKSVLEHGRFTARLRLLDRYQHALLQTMDVGRTIGDSFAWLFYQRDLALLRKHLSRPLDPHLPPGVGGQGELLLLKRIPKIGRLFVLYHGITTFLRVGDVTLIDLDAGRVHSIAEIKTQPIAPDRVEISLYGVGAKSVRRRLTVRKVDAPAHEKLKGRQRDALRRQIRRMASMFDRLPRRRDRKTSAPSAALDAIQRMRFPRTGFCYASAGPSLLFAGTRMGSLSLAGAFLPKRARKPVSVEGIEVRARDLVLPGSNFNALLVGHLSGHVFLETTPMFWWPIREEVLHDVFFHRAGVFSLYNPARLCESLKADGFEVARQDKGVSISRKIGDVTITMEGFDAFTRMVQLCLTPEEIVVSVARTLLNSVKRRMRRRRPPENVRINLVIAQYVPLR